MYLREISDLHLEFSPLTRIEQLIPPLPTDKKTVLIIAGDLISGALISNPFLLNLFSELLPRFKHVTYVLGNHEHYGSNINTELAIKSALSHLPPKLQKKLTIAGNEPVKKKIDDVTFLLGTLWTDYGLDSHPSKMAMIRRHITFHINDHRLIKNFTCQDGADIFAKTVGKLAEWMVALDNSRTVVVTHHLPSFRAVHPSYTMDESSRMMNHAFASDLDVMIIENQPAYWFFGHTHKPYAGDIFSTKLRCNPHGYPKERTSSYDSTQVYEL